MAVLALSDNETHMQTCILRGWELGVQAEQSETTVTSDHSSPYS